MRSRWSPLLRLAYAVTGDVGRAEDVLQEAFARLCTRWSRLREEDPDGYVRRMVVNEAISAGRRPWGRETPAAGAADQRPASSAEIDRVDDRAALAQALTDLPARQRAVVVLRYVEDLSEVQVADLLGCSVGTVKAHASRGIARLRAAHDACPALLSTQEEL